MHFAVKLFNLYSQILKCLKTPSLHTYIFQHYSCSIMN